MVALVISTAATLLLLGLIFLYGTRRPVGTAVTWGEAMFAAVVIFWLLFLIYGIVPHQWLVFADNELGWRKDKIMVGPDGFIADALPFTITYEVIRDLIAVGIYVVGLGANAVLWVKWQERGTKKPKELPRSAYGRPLVKPAPAVRGAAGQDVGA